MIKKILSIKFIRFSISGGIATLVDVIVLYALVEWFRVWYLAAAVPSFLVGSFVHFLISYFWVFEHERATKFWKKYLKFTSIHILSLFINLLLMYIFVEFLKTHYLIGKIAAIAGSLLWNFWGNKKFTFKKI
ncbi:MAG: GtrA family protein [Patescibacteria group bacterium]|nr:GtrA family protein [Patescibacteria group bacterium]